MSAGTSVLWPAASVETPTACTSFSIACRAASSGVWNSGPMSTSKPRSANAVATTFDAAVVAVLAELGDHDARPAAFLARRTPRCRRLSFSHIASSAKLRAVHARHALRRRAMAAPHRFQRVGDLADRRARAHRVDRKLEQIALARCAPPPSAPRACAATPTVSRVLRICARRLSCDSRTAVLSISRVSIGVFVFAAELVDADDHVLSRRRCAPASPRPTPRS